MTKNRVDGRGDGLSKGTSTFGEEAAVATADAAAAGTNPVPAAAATATRTAATTHEGRAP